MFCCFLVCSWAQIVLDGPRGPCMSDPFSRRPNAHVGGYVGLFSRRPNTLVGGYVGSFSRRANKNVGRK